MKTLIVIASHHNKSFNHALKDVLIELLEKSGSEVRIRDLYQMNFNPVLSSSDFEKLQSNNLPEEIKTEQEHILWAEKIIVLYPVWWTGMPAILKGYFDRILLHGFAYKFDKSGLVKLLEGKEALLVSTSGMPKDLYESIGMYEAMNLTSDIGIFDFVGIKVLEHIYYPSITSVSDDVRNEYLQSMKESFEKVFRNGK